MYKKINECGLKSLEMIEKLRVNFMFSMRYCSILGGGEKGAVKTG